MERYKVTQVLGDGTYGSVVRAQNKKTGEIVAVKKMKRKFNTWDECMALREVKALRKLTHPNIVKLREVIRENNELQLVFEFMETNLYSLIKDRARGLPEKKVRNIMYQLLQGLGYMHKHGYFHRDIKPENLLVTGETVKLADFGLVREIRARPPFTDYVSTRWYRAPEVILRMPAYSGLVDVWATGALMAELYTLRPLFPGSSESDQMSKICSVLGTPDHHSWPEGVQQAKAINFRMNQFVRVPFDVLVPMAHPDGHKVMARMLAWNPSNRLDCVGCLSHAYFQEHLEDVNPEFVGLLVGKPAAAAASSVAPANREMRSGGEARIRVPSAANARATPGSDRATPTAGGGGLPSLVTAAGAYNRVPSNGSSGTRASNRSRQGFFRGQQQLAAKYPGHGGLPGAGAYLSPAAPGPMQGLLGATGPPAHVGVGQQPPPMMASGTAPAAMSYQRTPLGSLGSIGGAKPSAFASAGRSIFAVH